MAMKDCLRYTSGSVLKSESVVVAIPALTEQPLLGEGKGSLSVSLAV